jgi:hypothetical protein
MSHDPRGPEGHLRPRATLGKKCDWVATRRDTRHVKASASPSTGNYYTALLSRARATLLRAEGRSSERYIDVLVMAASGKERSRQLLGTARASESRHEV